MFKQLALLLAAGVLALSGCSEKSLTNVEYGNQNQVLYIANGDEPQALDPHITTGAPDFHVISSMFEGLTALNPKTLELEPGAAASWELSDDLMTYTFHMQPEGRWSNGDPVTAQDFVYSWQRAMSPELANQYAYMMYFIEGAEAFGQGETTDFSTVGVKALDDKTLQVKLTAPTPYFLQILDHHTYYPVHPATIEKFGGMTARVSKWTLPGNLVSNNAFKLKHWELNKVIEVVPNEHYWDADVVKLEGIHFYPISQQQVEERAFRSGQVHLTFTPQMAIEKIATYDQNEPELIHKDPGYSNYFYIFNTTREPFDDVRVRKALSYAIDRESLVKRVTKGGEVPAYHFVPPDPEGHQPKSYFTYDVEKAKELLAEAGFPNGEGFPAFDILYNTHDNHRKIALAIQQMWRTNLNIQANLTNQEWKVYLNTQQNKDYDVSRKAWIADYLDPSNFYDLLLSYGGNNDTGWKSAEYDALVEEAQHELDTTKRWALYEQANKILSDEMPIAPLYFMSDINLIRPNVKNWYGNVLQRHPYKTVYLENEAK